MKKGIVTLVIFFTAAISLLAHEMDMDNTKGLLGLSPEYLHVLINPLPTYGVAIGIGVLFAGLLLRNIVARNIGLVIVLFCTGITWVVVHYGQHAYNHLYPDLDAETKRIADSHMDRAESFAWAYYATAVLSIIALAMPKYCKQKATSQVVANEPQAPDTKQTREPTPIVTAHPRKYSTAGTAWAIVVLVCAIISFAFGSWISRAGGRIRHTEFREQHPAPAQTAEPHQHHHD